MVDAFISEDFRGTKRQFTRLWVVVKLDSSVSFKSRFEFLHERCLAVTVWFRKNCDFVGQCQGVFLKKFFIVGMVFSFFRFLMSCLNMGLLLRSTWSVFRNFLRDMSTSFLLCGSYKYCCEPSPSKLRLGVASAV